MKNYASIPACVLLQEVYTSHEEMLPSQNSFFWHVSRVTTFPTKKDTTASTLPYALKLKKDCASCSIEASFSLCLIVRL